MVQRPVSDTFFRIALAVTWYLIPAVVGCASVRSYPAFFGRRVEPLAQSEAPTQGGDAVTAEGSVRSGLGPTQMTVRMANHGTRPLRMSYVMDAYTANTYNGRTIALEKADFLNYPDTLNPGEEAAILLHVPQDLDVREVAQLIARIHGDREPIILRPLNPMTRVAELVGARPGPSGRVVAEAPSLSSPQPAAPVGTVPVEVEFHQALGGSLRVTCRWDASLDPVTLAPGDRQLFYVVPGPHELHVVIQMPGVTETIGRVPVIVGTDRPVRISLEAQARLTGAQMQARVFHGSQTVFDQTFAPGPHG